MHVCHCVCAIDGLFLSGVTSLVSWIIIAFDVHSFVNRVQNMIIRFRVMQACCDVAFDYAHQREQFGRKIGTYQVSIL